VTKREQHHSTIFVDLAHIEEIDNRDSNTTEVWIEGGVRLVVSTKALLRILNSAILNNLNGGVSK
jgi:hypothetical protein